MTFIEEIKNHKKTSELQYVISLYQNPLYLDEHKLDPNKIDNKGWRMYYEIITRMVKDKSYNVVDEINVDLYVSQNEKLDKLYKKFGKIIYIK